MNSDKCAICGGKATMHFTNTGEAYCMSCANQVMIDPDLRRRRANIGRGGERRIVREGLSVGVVDEAALKAKKNIPQNYVPFRIDDLGVEFYYPEDWVQNPKAPMVALALMIPRYWLKGEFNANLTFSFREVPENFVSDFGKPKKQIEEKLKAQLVSRGLQKFKLHDVKQRNLAGHPAQLITYSGTMETYGIKLKMKWSSYSAHIASKEYFFTLTSDQKDHEKLHKELEKIITFFTIK